MFMTNYDMVYGKKSDGPVQRSYHDPVYPETIMSDTESDERSIRIVPAVIVAILLFCGAILLLLLNFDNLKKNLGQMLDKIKNDEEQSISVASQNDITDKNNTVSEKEDGAVENVNIKLEESNQFVEVEPGSESSRKILMNNLPELYGELSSDKGIVMGNARFDQNYFSICDIDFDGEAELLVKITTGSMAANGLYIYKADSSGQVIQEGSMSGSSDFYNNGYVKSPWSHNQGLGTLCPYTVAQYVKSEDKYTNIYSLDSWDKSANPISFNGEAFPDDIDVSLTGVIYYINNFISGEKSTCDYLDYVKWFNSWNQCSPKLNIKFEAFSEDNVRKYSPDFKKTETHSYLGKGYVATNDDDLNLRKEAATDSKVLTTIPKNTKLELYSSENSDWYFTTYQGKEGYVSADWVAFGEPPAVKKSEIYGLNPYLTGQISSGGKTIEGYTTDYVCFGGEQTVQWICEDTWHITAQRRTSSYGVDWYECWDTDDGDYYGWIDSKFLSFYSSGSSNNQSNSTNSVTTLSPYRTGEISSNGKKIEGYTTDYVCNGGAKTEQWICEDTWHITARRKTSSYGVEWYECWDTDDGDYYGWIDGKFLYFYR